MGGKWGVAIFVNEALVVDEGKIEIGQDTLEGRALSLKVAFRRGESEGGSGNLRIICPST